MGALPWRCLSNCPTRDEGQGWAPGLGAVPPLILTQTTATPWKKEEPLLICKRMQGIPHPLGQAAQVQ